MAHVRQSGPESGLDFQTKVVQSFQAVASTLGSGADRDRGGSESGGARARPSGGCKSAPSLSLSSLE